MTALAARPSETLLHLGGEMLRPLPEGALWWAAERVLVVSDLHLEKGSAYAARIKALTGAHDWVWVEGNHDPDPPAHLGGRAAKVVRIGSLVFRHEPTGEAGEIAGHLHPAAKVKGRGRMVRRRCFASDGARLVMPAMGAFTGGLNVLDDAFGALFPEGLMAFALGGERVFAVSAKSLVPDVANGARWRL
tara:strand:- start:1417 stop:1986 length:570 start_codon:yes stop_codon:yes gene_type:complete